MYFKWEIQIVVVHSTSLLYSMQFDQSENFLTLKSQEWPTSNFSSQNQYFIKTAKRLWQIIKWAPKETCFDLKTNSPNLYNRKCIEIRQENLYDDIGADGMQVADLRF